MYRISTWAFAAAAAVLVAACGGSGGAAVDDRESQAAAAAASPPGALITARAEHTATRLADGRVLVAGGSAAKGALADCEIYDPRTRAWKRAAPLNEARADARAVLLRDGRVLVTGGYAGFGTAQYPSRALVARGEIYDPGRNNWTPTAAPLQARAGHGATRLADGRVLVAGGVRPGQTGYPFESVADVEIYDPATDRWRAAASMPHPRSEHTAALQADGTVLIAGFDIRHALSAETLSLEGGIETYDPVADRWTPVAPMVDDVSYGLVAALPGRRVLVNRAVLDLDEGHWRVTRGFGADRAPNAPHVVYDDGTVVTAGGGWDLIMAYALVDSARQDVYDPVARRWRAGRSLAVTRRDHTLTLMVDGSVLVVGGRNRDNGVLRSVEILRRGEAERPRAVRSDFNGDGRSEILWRRADTGAVTRWVMDGLQRLSQRPVDAPDGARYAGSGDFNGDAVSDIVWTGPAAGAHQVWLMRGGARIGTQSHDTAPDFVDPIVADFDGSGHAGLQFQVPGGGLATPELQTTTSGFTYFSFAARTDRVARAWGDFNGDGRDDLVVEDTGSGATEIWFMQSALRDAGAGPRRIADPLPLALLKPGDHVRAAPDLDGDGGADLVVQLADGRFEAWVMNGTRLRRRAALAIGADWNVVATPDLDGDGREDLLLHRSVTGKTVAWLMNGTVRRASATLLTSRTWVPLGP